MTQMKYYVIQYVCACNFMSFKNMLFKPMLSKEN
jgi:hypothetical protein